MLIAVSQLKEKTLKVAINMPTSFPHAAKHKASYVTFPQNAAQF
jgi:hypothetical protein